MVANAMGDVTRNSVIGKVHRLGIQRAPAASRPKIKRKLVLIPRPKLPEERKPKTRHAIVESLHKAPATLPDPAHDLPPLVAFADLEEHHCRWIPGEPLGGCCGRPKVPRLPYCEVHSRRAYEARPISKRPVSYGIKSPAVRTIKYDIEVHKALEEFTAP